MQTGFEEHNHKGPIPENYTLLQGKAQAILFFCENALKITIEGKTFQAGIPDQLEYLRPLRVVSLTLLNYLIGLDGDTKEFTIHRLGQVKVDIPEAEKTLINRGPLPEIQDFENLHSIRNLFGVPGVHEDLFTFYELQPVFEMTLNDDIILTATDGLDDMRSQIFLLKALREALSSLSREEKYTVRSRPLTCDGVVMGLRDDFDHLGMGGVTVSALQDFFGVLNNNGNVDITKHVVSISNIRLADHS